MWFKSRRILTTVQLCFLLLNFYSEFANRSREMVGPQRPEFVFFGSSIVQLSFSNDGWASTLADTYSRKADIILRGYAGWNSRQALKVLQKIFPKDAAEQPALVVVYFGGNDAMGPPPPQFPSGFSPHVPLPEYIENMRNIALHIKSLSAKTRLIFLSPPPADEEAFKAIYGEYIIRSNETLGEYSDALLHLCREMGITAIDLWTLIQQVDDWKNVSFIDGVHFTEEGSKIVSDAILKVLSKANWEPSLDSTAMPTEFAEYDKIPTVPISSLFPGKKIG